MDKRVQLLSGRAISLSEGVSTRSVSLVSYQNALENCTVGNEFIRLPVSLLTEKDIYQEVFSYDAWSLLDQKDKEQLSKYLPKNVCEDERELFVRQLLDVEKNVHFGHPIKKFVSDLKNGHFDPSISKVRSEIVEIRDTIQKISWNNSLHESVREISKVFEVSKLPTHGITEQIRSEEELLKRQQRRLEILKRKITTKVTKKRKRRALQRKLEARASLYLELLDKDEGGTDSDGSVTDVDSNVEDSAADEDYEELTRKAKRHKQYKLQKKRKEAAAVKDTPRKTTTLDFPVFSLFTTLKDVFQDSNNSADVTTLAQAISQSPPLMMTIPPQYGTNSFVELALRFLSHPPRLPQQITADVHIPSFCELVSGSMWRWKEPMDSTYNSRLESLEQLFYFTVTRKKVNTDETGKISIPFNLIKQQKCKVTIPETSPYAVDLFHAQERERFENCNKPYIFDIQGVKSIVAPLKKSSNTSLRAREHALLIENRPGQINLLSLIRNAAARLPGGVGTRADVAQLMKDSQYVKPGSSDNKLNQVVSGALDRLQSASDPPVNYDQDQKLWIYLHRLRTEEDFAAEEEGDDDFDNDE